MDAQDGAPEHGCENGAVAAAKEAAALAQACETQIPGDVEQTSAQCTASGGEDFRCERTSRRSSCVAHEVGAGVGGPDAPEGESTRAITSAQVVQDSEGSGVSGAQCRKQLVEPSTGTQENAEVADSPHAAREVPVVDEKWHKSGKEPDTWTQALRNTAAQIEAFEEEEKKTTDPLADAEARNIVMLSLASQDCANHHHLFQHLNKELAEARAVALEAESRKVAAEYRLAANDAALHTYVSSSEHSEVQKMVLTNTEGMRQRIEQLETSLQQTQGEVVLSNALLAESSTRAAVCEGERGSWNACMLAYSFAMKSLAAEAREQVEAKEGQLRETRLLLRKQSDQHVEEAARLHEQRRVADETRAMERKARVAAERCATHTAVEARERVKQIESELHRRGIDYRFTVRDLQDKASRRSVASRVAEDATEAAKHAEEMMRRAFLQEKAKLQAQHSVATHDLQMQLKQATDSLASMQQDLEGHAASRRLAEKQVESLQQELTRMRQQYMTEASGRLVDNKSFGTQVELLEKELREAKRVAANAKERFEAERGKWRDDVRAATDGHLQEKAQWSSARAGIETAAHAKETDLEVMNGELQVLAGRCQRAEQLRAAAEEETIQAREEADRFRQNSLSVHDNFHYKILKDQCERQAADIQHLNMNVKTLTARVRDKDIDCALLGTPARMGQLEQDVAQRQKRVHDLETQVEYFSTVVSRVVAELSQPVPGLLPAADESSDVTRCADTNLALGSNSGLLLSALSPSMQRDLALCAQDGFKAPIREPNWTEVSPLLTDSGSSLADAMKGAAARKKLSPLPAGHPSSPLSFAGLPRQAPGSIDSSLYFTAQRAKLVPSIYDLDW